MILRRLVANPSILGNWAVVRMAAVTLAVVFRTKGVAELHSLWCGGCPVGWPPSWGLRLVLTLVLALALVLASLWAVSTFGRVGAGTIGSVKWSVKGSVKFPLSFQRKEASFA